MAACMHSWSRKWEQGGTVILLREGPSWERRGQVSAGEGAINSGAEAIDSTLVIPISSVSPINIVSSAPPYICWGTSWYIRH